MKKLKLQMEDLRVDTFDTTAVRRDRGTVVGEQQCTCQTVCTCPGCPTCYNTCQGNSCEGQSCIQGTCAATCDNYPYEQPCTYGREMQCVQ